MELPDVAKIERLSLRPDDRLVLTVDHPLNDEEFTQLADRMHAWLSSAGVPEVKGRVLILEAGVSLQVLEAPAASA